MEEQRTVCHTLKSSASLLPSQEDAEKAFEKFDATVTRVEKYVCLFSHTQAFSTLSWV